MLINCFLNEWMSPRAKSLGLQFKFLSVPSSGEIKNKTLPHISTLHELECHYYIFPFKPHFFGFNNSCFFNLSLFILYFCNMFFCPIITDRSFIHPRTQECVACVFFPAQELNRVSCIAGWFFTNWAIREAQGKSESRSGVWLFATSWTVVHGILQARILEWVTIPFARGLPNPGIEPRSPTLQEDSSLIAQLVKNVLAMQETLVWFLGWEDSLEKG